MKQWVSKSSGSDIAVLTAILSSGNFIAGKVLVEVLSPINAIIVRFAIAILIFFFVLDMSEFKKVTHRDALILFFSGLFGMTAYNLLFFNAALSAPALNLALINATIPVQTLIAAALVHRHIPSSQEILAFIVAFIGVLLVLTQGVFDANLFTLHKGELLMVAAASSWVLYGMLVQQLSRKFSSWLITFCSVLSGFLFLLPVALVQGLFEKLPHMQSPHWFVVFYMGIIGTTFSGTFYAVAVKKLGPSVANVITFSSTPVFVGVLSYFIFGTPITQWHIVGGGLVICALMLGLRK